MSERLEIRCAIEIRADASRQSPGRIVGTLMTYGQRARDRAEVFADGALTWPDDGIVINKQHDRRQAFARVVPEVRGNEVVVDFQVPDTQTGRDVVTLVKSGVLKGMSVEFRAVRDRWNNGVREIGSALLRGAALVDSPSYPTTVEARARGGSRRRLRPWH